MLTYNKRYDSINNLISIANNTYFSILPSTGLPNVTSTHRCVLLNALDSSSILYTYRVLLFVGNVIHNSICFDVSVYAVAYIRAFMESFGIHKILVPH